MQINRDCGLSIPQQPSTSALPTKRLELFPSRTDAPKSADPTVRTYIEKPKHERQENGTTDLGQITEHMETIGANGVHIGTVGYVEGIASR